MALAAFATGGLQDRLLQHEPQSITAFLGNPNAREADFMASAEDEHSPPGYAVYCKGCGPGIQERMWSRHAYDVYGEIAPPAEYAPYEYESPYGRSEEHTSELQSLRRSSYAFLCLKDKMEKARSIRKILKYSPRVQ